ncbi:dihydropteroate synthase [Candidatus Aerophobetes bacterium]|uniref:Dihydropteroate synthase n=1 Tax=Aerophobetes bacterium TaxID=2030807 RepID=A0A523QKC9_UNCAE|nr:MAG: dihydropteroate synthase [Candidatus Aerophobetes bacterium]
MSPGRGMLLHLRSRDIDLEQKVVVMGILNVTPDSFYDGGRYTGEDEALARVEEMIGEGADIIDVGGESVRPGVDPIGLDEELGRVIPVIEKIKRQFSIPICVDTYKAEVARQAIEEGAEMVNDISALRFDPDLRKIVAGYGVPVVLMHIKGTPKNMQDNPRYDSLMEEIISYLDSSIKLAEEAGADGRGIIVDPGIGFGKTTAHNLEILRRLEELASLGKPILVGLSRKSFIGNVLGLPQEERLEGGLAATCMAVWRGARLVRTHDVSPTRRAVDMVQAILGSSG